MNTFGAMEDGVEFKRVGRSGQISIGKRYAGRFFREELRNDGSIVLTPVAVLPESHWTVRDQAKIVKALRWASKTPPRPSEVDEVLRRAQKPRSSSRRAQ